MNISSTSNPKKIETLQATDVIPIDLQVSKQSQLKKATVTYDGVTRPIHPHVMCQDGDDNLQSQLSTPKANKSHQHEDILLRQHKQYENNLLA